ncbi:ankyrin repeat protein [Ilyonectria robusta]
MDPLAVISGTITIVESILVTYDAIMHLRGLPKAFEEVGQNLPLAKETLELARRQLKEADPDESGKRALESAINGCHEKVQALNDIFKKIENNKEQSHEAKHWSALASFYHKVVVPMGKAYRVEDLMRAIMNELKGLAIHQMFKASTQGQVEKLEKAIKELSEVEPSLPESAFETGSGNVSQNISDHGRGFVSQGGYVDNTMGNKFNAANDMNFGMDFVKLLSKD